MPPEITPLNADFSVAPQLQPEQLVDVAAAGFRSVINNRPDFEGGPAQPTNADIEGAALRAGLRYAYLPIVPSRVGEAEILAFGELVATLPKPILAFCKTGIRCAKLYEISAATDDGLMPR